MWLPFTKTNIFNWQSGKYSDEMIIAYLVNAVIFTVTDGFKSVKIKTFFLAHLRSFNWMNQNNLFQSVLYLARTEHLVLVFLIA